MIMTMLVRLCHDGMVYIRTQHNTEAKKGLSKEVDEGMLWDGGRYMWKGRREGGIWAEYIDEQPFSRAVTAYRHSRSAQHFSIE